MNDRRDDGDRLSDPDGVAQPKYRASDFMRKEIALFHRARMQLRTLQRYGDNDEPVMPVQPLRAVRAVRPPRGFDARLDTEA